MKKTWIWFLILLATAAWIFILVLPAKACDYCRLSLPLKQGCDTVALKVGGQSVDCRKEFLRQLVTGFYQSGAAIVPANTKFSWIVDNEGFVRQTFLSNRPLSGRIFAGNVCGKEIIFFYPLDNGFLVGLTIGKPTKTFSVATIKPTAYQPSVKMETPTVPKQEFIWDGTEVEVPPMEQDEKPATKPITPKTTQKRR